MNLLMPISTIMSRKFHVVSDLDNVKLVKEIFDRKSVSHILVMRNERIVGTVTRCDFLSFFSGLNKQFENTTLTQSLLQMYTVREVMNGKVTFIESNDRIHVALEMFRDNIFTALPVIDEEDRLVGMVTAMDIVKALAKEKATELHFSIF